jgi:hypothetical protein
MKTSNTVHKKLRREIALSTEIIRGSLVVMKRVCGKSNCKCQKGHKHTSLYLSRSCKGKTSMIYIPRKNEAKVKAASLRYHTIINLLNQLSEIHLKKVTVEKGK